MQVEPRALSADKTKVGATRLARIVLEMGVGPLINGLGEHSLGEFIQAGGGEPVIIVDTLVVPITGHALRGRIEAARGLEGVQWVELLAEIQAASTGGEKSSVTVLRQGSKPEPTAAGAQHGLGPLVIIRVKAGELFKTGTDLGIETVQSLSMEAGGHGPDREDHFAKGRAVPEQL
jgi:hypothetical protein